jgi:hypothetical protein
MMTMKVFPFSSCHNKKKVNKILVEKIMAYKPVLDINLVDKLVVEEMR